MFPVHLKVLRNYPRKGTFPPEELRTCCCCTIPVVSPPKENHADVPKAQHSSQVELS